MKTRGRTVPFYTSDISSISLNWGDPDRVFLCKVNDAKVEIPGSAQQLGPILKGYVAIHISLRVAKDVRNLVPYLSGVVLLLFTLLDIVNKRNKNSFVGRQLIGGIK